MNPDDLARILDELTSRLGPGGEYVFGLAVRQKIIEGIVGLSLILVLIGIAVVVSLVARWRINLENAKYPDPASDYHLGLGWKVLAHAVIWSLTAAVVAAVGLGAMTNLLNPEYAALTDILSRIVP